MKRQPVLIDADEGKALTLFQRMTMLVMKAAFGGRAYSVSDPEFGAVLARITGTGTHAGVSVNDTTAMTVTAFWACVRLLSETVGGMPWAVYEKDRSGNYTYVDHDLSIILTESPNSDMTELEFKETMGFNLAQQGNVVSLKEARSDGSIISLYPIPWGRCSVGIKEGKIIYDIYDRGRWEPYPHEKVWHVKGFGPNGIVGLSPLMYSRQALGTALASEEFQARFFANGASPSFIVSVPQWLDEKQRGIARENLEQLMGGLGNAHKARLLEGGMKPEGGTMPLKEAQFQELRGFSVQEVARAMHVPLHLIGDLSGSTNNNIEQQALEFLMYTIMPYTSRIEKSATRWLLKPEERKRFFLRFNLDGLLRADASTRGELLSKMVNNGILNRNEARAYEGKNSSNVLGMNDFTVQTAMAPIDMLREIADKMATKPVPSAPDKSKGIDMINIMNSLPGQRHEIVVYPPEVQHEINVHPAKVNVGAPQVTVDSPVTVPAVDMTAIAEALRAFAVVGGALIKTMEGNKDVDILKDDDGNLIGTRRVKGD